ncbi:MAG: hypothetical protein Q4E70_01975 [Candidatus Saccharibacteria bacterium]|nr:hypothetical protein [Candidatus Saccharibacteria bacterium]
MGELVLRDSTTGESKVFTASTIGYQQAEQWRNERESANHIVTDDNSGSLGRLNSIYPPSNY